MNHVSRATALKIATVLSLLVNFYGFIVNIPLLARGSTALEAMGGAPYSVIVVLFTLSVVAIAASYGVWHQQRWAMVLTIMAAVVNLLAALPGILFAPTWYWQLSSATYVITGIAVIILCLWRERALATR